MTVECSCTFGGNKKRTRNALDSAFCGMRVKGHGKHNLANRTTVICSTKRMKIAEGCTTTDTGNTRVEIAA